MCIQTVDTVVDRVVVVVVVVESVGCLAVVGADGAIVGAGEEPRVPLCGCLLSNVEDLMLRVLNHGACVTLFFPVSGD